MKISQEQHLIVVVDDDLDTLDLVSAYFRPKGYKILCFSDAEKAIEESRRTGHTWDVLLTDLNFPQMHGAEFPIQIKEALPNLPVIVITEPELVDKALEAVQKGAYDLLVKPLASPIHFSQLQISVERALHLKTLKVDISELREMVKSNAVAPNKIVGRSPKFLLALDIAKRVASSSANIFVSGESGTGKEVITRFIHDSSEHRAGPFVAINCSAIPENLLESELFGHAKGSFTGANEKKIGLFEEAQDGTLFLDEIGDLSPSLQAKLLRVLQDRKIRRVGENQYRDINCRIISATHRNLALEVKEKRFREDLYFRLNVIPIEIPPLRERLEDLIPLAESFLRKYALQNASRAKSFSKEAIKFLLENQWRGNVRELENTVERAVVLCSGHEISLENFMPLSSQLNSDLRGSDESLGENIFAIQFSDRLPSLDDVIHRYVEFAVERNGGARDKTAIDIGIDRKTLYRRMKPEGDIAH